ncbi:hypothetical protein ACHAWO_001365 [Cyclotella atomus]|uniref:K Homology domain-containing protein n=1 Tax=Cyclotella atomus TaxID=382360 RepID=A0ABD3QMU4_9STRA
MSTSDDLSSPSPSIEESTEDSPVAFDIAAKLTARLSSHALERNHQRHHIDTLSTQLSNLLKATPKRPKDSKAALTGRIAKLEKERTSKSLNLSSEKALLREIASAQKSLRQHAQCESHQEAIWRKRSEIESAKESLRSTESSISEMEKVLATVQLAKRLNCTTAELITREYITSVEKMNGILLDIQHLLLHAEEKGVHVTVDKIHGKFVIKGNADSVQSAMEMIENSANKIDVQVELTEDQTLYLQQPIVLTGLKDRLMSVGSGDCVKFDFLARVHRMVLTGGPSHVSEARDIVMEVVDVVAEVRGGLDSKQAGIVVGKHGATMHDLSSKYGVVMSLFKESSSNSSDTSCLKIIGPSSKVKAAFSEVNTLLLDNEQIKETFNVDKIMKGELIHNSGASIKEFEQAVSNAVNATVFLTMDRNAPSPTLVLKCPRCAMEKANNLVSKKIKEFESNIVSVEVSPEIIPAIIGKGGSKIESLQQLGGGAVVDADKTAGMVKIYSRDASSREAVQTAVQQIIDENQVGFVDNIEKKSLGFLFGDPGKETMAAVAELKCNVQVSEEESKLTVRGTKENIVKACEVLKEFMNKNYVLELDIHAEDETLLFSGGEKSLLHTVKSRYDVKALFRKDRGVLQIRGEVDKVEAAKKEVEEFLYGGEGITVIKFKVPEDAIGSIVGKGGDNLTKLESEFEGVRIHIPRDSNTVSLRGPEDNVKKCRIKLVTEIATYRVSDTMDLTPGQHSDISNDVDTIKRIAGSSGTSISLIEGSIKIRGVSRDVRDAKALLREHFSGSYSGYIDLNVPQYDRLKSTLSKDASHFERVKLSTGAGVVLDETESAIKITGKKANVKKAKLSLMGFLDFVFPKQIQTVKVHKTLFKSMCDPEKLAEVAVATSASVYLDRDLISVVVNSESADDATKAVELVNARLVESEKLNYVFRLATADAWLLPLIIGKAGKNVKKIEAATGCSIDVFKDELSVVVRGESKDAVQSGREAVEAIVDQARKECVFVELPESAIPAFVGKGGAHIKQLSAAHEVEIEKTKKHQSTIKITGKEEAVANAKDSVLSWLSEWEVSHTGLSIDVEEQFIPAIIGKSGETIRSIQKDTKCKIDIDRIHSTLTVREGTESARIEAMDRIKTIIEEEKAIASERAAEKEKLSQEQAELARVNAKAHETSAPSGPSDLKTEDTTVDDLSGIKDRSKEFSARPVGWAASKSKTNDPSMDAIEVCFIISSDEILHCNYS